MKDVISVIVPVYNAEKTLRRCVESIVYGSYRNVEVILIEDHSTDESWALCQTLSQEFDNVRALRNDRNRGVSHARNRGLDAATGDYIMFCDSDDWVSGCYAREMLNLAKSADYVLPICGFHFVDNIRKFRQDYVWNNGSGAVTDVPLKLAFDVMDKTLLQQLWTKVFSRRIIQNNGLSFDENQSIGEDFQFVLDYIRCGSISHFRILDKALYYYIRTGGSLMAKFGLVDRENEYARLKILREITADNVRYEHVLLQVKRNYVFHAMRSSLSKKEQLEFAKKLLGAEANTFYRYQRYLQTKDAVRNGCVWSVRLLLRAINKLKQLKNRILVQFMRKQIFVQDVTIFSQNCIGGVFYHDMGLAFQSPTIDLYFSGADFISFSEAPEKYLSTELSLVWDEEYPIGWLGDVKIHFMHYNHCSDALASWERRLSRVQMDKIVILCTDMEGFTPELFARWQKLPYSKVLFTANKAYIDADSVYLKRYHRKPCVPDLIPNREFYKNGKIIAAINKISGDH